MLKFPSIPEPQADVNALYQSVSALKQIAEELVGQRGTDGTTIASQTDLASVSDLLSVVQKAAANASPVGHTHPESDVTSLVADIASKEPAVTGTGNASQYWGGDKTFHTQRLVAAYSDTKSTTTSVSVIIPVDGTAPQSTEGTQIFSRSVTTTSATQVIKVWAVVGVQNGTVSAYVSGALFAGTTCFGWGFVSAASANTLYQVSLLGQYAPGAAGAYTISLRVGPSAAETVSVSPTSGGVDTTGMFIEVIEP